VALVPIPSSGRRTRHGPPLCLRPRHCCWILPPYPGAVFPKFFFLSYEAISFKTSLLAAKTGSRSAFFSPMFPLGHNRGGPLLCSEAFKSCGRSFNRVHSFFRFSLHILAVPFFFFCFVPMVTLDPEKWLAAIHLGYPDLLSAPFDRCSSRLCLLLCKPVFCLSGPVFFFVSRSDGSRSPPFV